MVKRIKRTPKNFDGINITSRRLDDLLPSILSNLNDKYGNRGDLIIDSWPQIIGPQFAPMTKALSFDNGILIVIVKNSSLYSMLVQVHKSKLLNSLKKHFPNTYIKDIVFRIG